MNYSTAIFLISDKVRAVGVTYEATDNAPVTIFKTLDQDIKVDDYVVVPTDTRHKMTVCKVKMVDMEIDFDMSANVAWIVGRVDCSNVDDLKAQEDDAIIKIKAAEKNRKRNELRDSLMAVAGDGLKALPIYSVNEEKKG